MMLWLLMEMEFALCVRIANHTQQARKAVGSYNVQIEEQDSEVESWQ